MDIFLVGKSDTVDWDQSYVDRGQGGRFEATYEVIDNDTQDPDEQEFNDERMKLIDESYKIIY